MRLKMTSKSRSTFAKLHFGHSLPMFLSALGSKCGVQVWAFKAGSLFIRSSIDFKGYVQYRSTENPP
jgi:hypothetical protein